MPVWNPLTTTQDSSGDLDLHDPHDLLHGMPAIEVRPGRLQEIQRAPSSKGKATTMGTLYLQVYSQDAQRCIRFILFYTITHGVVWIYVIHIYIYIYTYAYVCY